jgi:hypothetical protein
MPAALVLEHAICHVYQQAQLTRSENEHEDFTITLRMLALVCDGWPGGPGLFNLACGYATGLAHGKYMHRRDARSALLHQELLRCIPDYDYSNEMPPEDDPTDGRRQYYGNRFDRSRDLDSSPGSWPDTSGNGCEDGDGDYAAAGGRVGDRTNAQDQYSPPSRARATGRPGVADAYRREPKQISSPAQREALARAQRIAREFYFGA